MIEYQQEREEAQTASKPTSTLKPFKFSLFWLAFKSLGLFTFLFYMLTPPWLWLTYIIIILICHGITTEERL